MRIGTGFDVHRLVSERALLIGGVKIDFEKGLLGHSDADVLLHALMDAILGALCLGDIGHLFPDSDEAYRGADSGELTKIVASLMEEKGYGLENADVTVVCERPKMAPYIPAIRKNIAELLNTEPERISVKATTTEKLGFTGREEGIAALATVLLKEI